MDQTRSQGEDSSRDMQRYCHVGLDRATAGLSEADGVLLMELLELEDDSSALPFVDDMLDGDVDRLSRVIRSLEAEIGGGSTPTPAAGAGECRTEAALDEMLVDLYSYDQGDAAFGYWAEVLSVGGWHVCMEEGEAGSIVAYEIRDQQCWYVDQGSIEQVYSPLVGMRMRERTNCILAGTNPLLR